MWQQGGVNVVSEGQQGDQQLWAQGPRAPLGDAPWKQHKHVGFSKTLPAVSRNQSEHIWSQPPTLMTANRLTLLLFAMVENSGKRTQRFGPKDNIEVKAEAEGNHNSPNIFLWSHLKLLLQVAGMVMSAE